MTGFDPDPASARAAMVARQLRARGIADERVLDAMGAIPREAFVPEGWRREAYADEALPIDAGQTISQPVIVARMTELLQVESGDRVLEIGTGSGYQAAILAWLGAEVTSLERQHSLVEPARRRLAALGLTERVTIREADGSLGYAAGAPWDAIIVTAAAPAIPMPLREQLADGARLVIPVGPRDHQYLTVVERRGNEWTEWTDGACVFVPLIGAGGFDGPPGGLGNTSGTLGPGAGGRFERPEGSANTAEFEESGRGGSEVESGASGGQDDDLRPRARSEPAREDEDAGSRTGPEPGASEDEDAGSRTVPGPATRGIEDAGARTAYEPSPREDPPGPTTRFDPD